MKIFTTDVESENELLRAQSQKTPLDNTEEMSKILEVIKETLEYVEKPKNKALGMAAPQVGSPYSWFVMRTRHNVLRVIINPYIKFRSGRKQDVEGCFSQPNNPAKVKRAKTVVAVFTEAKYDKDTNTWSFHDNQMETFEYRDAQVFQHEFDHLHGILLGDKKDSPTQPGTWFNV
jgi:peptide deformylase